MYVRTTDKDRSENREIYRVGLWFLGCALSLIAIYLYTKFYLNAQSSFKVICQTRYWTNGRTDRAATICFPFVEHKKGNIVSFVINL